MRYVVLKARVIDTLAHRLGTEPSEDSVKFRIFCGILADGVLRQDAESNLTSNVGDSGGSIF